MSQGSETIEEIFQRLRHGPGREESFQLLFDRFYWPLFRFFENQGSSMEECQDLIQETFLRVHRGIETFRGETRWEHWLFRIASNTAITAVRRRAAGKRAGREVLLESQEAVGAPSAAACRSFRGVEMPEPLRRLLGKERMELLRHAVADLPAQMRRCVHLRVFQGLDIHEIAESLQISPSTVRVHLHKAHLRLLKALGRELVFFQRRVPRTPDELDELDYLYPALGILATEEAAEIGPHIGLKRLLITYRRGTLPAAERMKDHLSLCTRCTGLLRELRDFETAWSAVNLHGRARKIDVAVAPRFPLRGQEAPENCFLRGGGAVNAVQVPAQADRFTVALSLDDHPAYDEYRLELVNLDGQLDGQGLWWAGRRSGMTFRIGAGTTVLAEGFGPGHYRLRIKGLHPRGSDFLAEYLITVECQEMSSE